MKKIGFVLCIIAALTLAACGKGNETSDGSNTQVPVSGEENNTGAKEEIVPTEAPARTGTPSRTE